MDESKFLKRMLIAASMIRCKIKLPPLGRPNPYGKAIDGCKIQIPSTGTTQAHQSSVADQNLVAG
jgi:hypothetical protein